MALSEASSKINDMSPEIEIEFDHDVKTVDGLPTGTSMVRKKVHWQKGTGVRLSVTIVMLFILIKMIAFGLNLV